MSTTANNSEAQIQKILEDFQKVRANLGSSSTTRSSSQGADSLTVLTLCRFSRTSKQLMRSRLPSCATRCSRLSVTTYREGTIRRACIYYWVSLSRGVVSISFYVVLRRFPELRYVRQPRNCEESESRFFSLHVSFAHTRRLQRGDPVTSSSHRRGHSDQVVGLLGQR